MTQSSALRSTTLMTEEEYLAFERASLDKHEYLNGWVYAMAGASRRHNLITSNIVRRLGNQLDDRPCEIYASDMRVRIPRNGRYIYPDVVVVCGEPHFLDGEFDTLLNPLLVVEVLSSSTRARDFSDKFRDYRSIESFAEYLLVEQDRRSVNHYARRDGLWMILDVAEQINLVSLPCVLTLDEIYQRVTFDENEAENAAAQENDERREDN